ncbi:MAG: hypothetical protein JW908_02740 [Anaerolineales bacterium]|nr:hypothetical protein [Anaerolineales bacterium]
MVFNQDFRAFIQALTDNQVRYLLVGGYAATLHGFPRRPKYLELWIEASLENARGVVRALEQLKLGFLGFTENDFKTEDQITQVTFVSRQRAIINAINAIEFGACFEKRAHKNVDEITVDVIALEHLRINKSNLWTVTGLGRT